MRKIRISIALALIVSFLVSVASFEKTCDEIRENVLRLHVVASSDSASDQSLKLKIRDAVLEEGGNIFDGSVDIKSAEEKIKPCLSDIKKTAQRVASENGFDYDVSVTLKRELFPTRTYENVTLPSGKYLALRIVIGEGKGHNWWCVMFPALCLPAAKKNTEICDVLSESGTKLVYKNPKYEPRFKIVEVIERIKNGEFAVGR